MLKIFDLLRSLGWYLISFIYNLIDTLLEIIKKLNSFDIINSLSNNKVFVRLYHDVIVISITLFSLIIIWNVIKKMLEPDSEITFKNIFIDTIKCGFLIMLSTFLFVQVSNFSIALSNYTGNIFEDNTNNTMSSNMLQMFISYNEDYENSEKFNETNTINELVSNGDFEEKELYLSKYVTKAKVLFADEKDYKYNVDWIMSILCGGFFLYSLFFAGMMLGRRQIEFLFLFAISPIVYATSVCNKQRRIAVVEQLVSLTLQSAVVMLIVNLTVMVMLQINETTFFMDNTFQNTIVKALLYLGCATFILTGSQVINRFIGANVSASSGREQMMSLMGYGKMAGTTGIVAGAGAIGGGLITTGGAIKVGNNVGGMTLSTIGQGLGTYGTNLSSDKQPTRLQKVASVIGNKMYLKGNEMLDSKKKNNFSPSDAFMNIGANSIGNAVRKVMLRASYNPIYYRNKKTKI